MTALPYSIARMRMQPGDAILTADPAWGARFIRLYTGDDWSHIAGIVKGPPINGRNRVYVAEAHLDGGIQRHLLSRWWEVQGGRACWIPGGLDHDQQHRFSEAGKRLVGAKYEGIRDFVLQSLGLNPEQGEDRDKICSAFYAACWEAATGDVIPGRPWFRWALPIRRGRCVPTPGAVARYLEGLGCQPVELVRG